MNKCYIVDKGSFKQIEYIICDCAKNGANKDSIVYARVDNDNNICTITGGNIFNMIRGLASLIKHMSIKSGAPVTLIVKLISDLLEEGFNDEV